jgi:Prion-inhibition and propagation/Het-s 218-289
MAEIFGATAAALSVAALFNNCVDCFEYIQLGRHFGRDYQTCQLKLDVAKTRLGRWGQALDINDDPRFDTKVPSDQSIQLAQSILEEIVLLFESVHKTSKRYEMVAKKQDLVLFEEKDMKPTFRGLHNLLKERARWRQKNTSLVKKTAWALYDGKSFERMADQITGFVDDLEKLFPVEAACRRLAEIEIEEIEDESSLTALKDAADGTDKVLLDAVVQKAQTIAGRNYAKDIKADNSADVQVGNQFSEAILVHGIAITDRTVNSVERVVAKGTSKVQIGNRFGVRF